MFPEGRRSPSRQYPIQSKGNPVSPNTPATTSRTKPGGFHKVPRIDDSRLAELFAHEVLTTLVHKELLSPEWADRLLSWRHTGFNVHSRVRAKTKPEAERVGKYMIRPQSWTLAEDEILI